MTLRQTGEPRPASIPGLSKTSEIPAHVPPELVYDLDVYEAASTAVDPWAKTAEVFSRLPRIVYWPKPRPGRFDGAWVATRYEDIREVYQNDEVYSTRDSANFQNLVGETFRMIPMAIDPPEHGKYRLFLNPWFSPKAVNHLEGDILASVNELIDGFAAAGKVDAAYDFGRIYPVRVFLNLMGFPLDLIDQFLSWEYQILHSHGDAEVMRSGISSALQYLRSFIEEVRRQPRPGLGSQIVHGSIDGRPLSEDEILGTTFFLWVGGLDTVASSTVLILRRLALQPDLQAYLRDDLSLIPQAVEEFLRTQPIVTSSRYVKKDHVLGGVKIKEGDHILCFNSAGNFDPAEFEASREFVLDRASNRHFTLGGGPHRCLGSHLARRELRIALTQFLSRIPTFSLAPGADRTAHPGLMSTAHLPLVWKPGAALAA